MEKHELQRCPFCGWQPPGDLIDTLYPTGRWREDDGMRHYLLARDDRPEHGKVWTMHCTVNLGGCGASVKGDSREEAIAAWERRQSGYDPQMGFIMEAANAGELAAYDHGCKGMMAALDAILRGEDTGEGVSNEPWEGLRRRVIALVKQPTMAADIAQRLHEKDSLYQPVPEGCTPADAQVLREANHAFAQEVQQLRQGLYDRNEVIALADLQAATMHLDECLANIGATVRGNGPHAGEFIREYVRDARATVELLRVAR